MTRESAREAQGGGYAGGPTGFRRLTPSLLRADRMAALFETRPGVRTLAKWTDITEQNSYFMCRRAYVEANEPVITKIIAEFGRSAEWARSHRPELAGLLASGTGMPLDAVQRGVDRAPLMVLPMSDELARGQQKIADRFRGLGLIPTEFKVSEQIWRAGA